MLFLSRPILLCVALLWALVLPAFAGAAGLPILASKGACAYQSMKVDFEALGSVEGLEGLSMDLLHTLERHKQELSAATDDAGLACDPDNDFLGLLSDDLDEVVLWVRERARETVDD